MDSSLLEIIKALEAPPAVVVNMPDAAAAGSFRTEVRNRLAQAREESKRFLNLMDVVADFMKRSDFKDDDHHVPLELICPLVSGRIRRTEAALDRMAADEQLNLSMSSALRHADVRAYFTGLRDLAEKEHRALVNFYYYAATIGGATDPEWQGSEPPLSSESDVDSFMSSLRRA
jgi:hypothetical protein